LNGKRADVANELPSDGVAETVIVEVEDILLRDRRHQARQGQFSRSREREKEGRLTYDNVVSEGVLNERQSVVGDLGDELDPLRVGGVVDAPLEDAASVSVGGDLDAVSGDGVVDELVVVRDEPVQALLDDVVSVEVLDERDDVGGERHDDGVDLKSEERQITSASSVETTIGNEAEEKKLT
jgi:stalled ribosome alternative rescue factor ArfA